MQTVVHAHFSASILCHGIPNHFILRPRDFQFFLFGKTPWQTLSWLALWRMLAGGLAAMRCSFNTVQHCIMNMIWKVAQGIFSLVIAIPVWIYAGFPSLLSLAEIGPDLNFQNKRRKKIKKAARLIFSWKGDMSHEDQPPVKRARLVLQEEPDDGLVRSKNNGKTSFILGEEDKTSFLIGRTEGAGCLVAHVGVSRRHASLDFRVDSDQGPVWSITDLKVRLQS